MSVERNKETIRRWAAAGDRRALDEFDLLFTEDTVDHVGGKTGVEWWKEIFRRINASFPDWSWSEIMLVAEADHVAFRGTITATHRGSELPFLKGAEPVGRPVIWRHHHTFRLVEGRIAEHWANRDDLGVLRQLTAIRTDGGGSGAATRGSSRRRAR